MTRNTNISLAAGFLIIISLMVVVEGFGFLRMHQIKARFEDDIHVNDRKIELIHSLRLLVRERYISLQSMIISDDPFLRDQLYLRHVGFADRFLKDREELESLVEVSTVAEEAELLARLQRLMSDAGPVQGTVRELLRSNDVDWAIRIENSRSKPLQDRLVAGLDKALGYYRSRSRQSLVQTERIYSQTSAIQTVLMAVTLLLSLMVAIWVVRRVRASETRLLAEIEHSRSMEEALLDHRENLEDLIEERTLELSYQATHDALTGLLNRFEFERRLDQSLTLCKTSGSQSAVLFLDLDRFKIINDCCGHPAGDALLRQLSEALGGRLRKADALARLGGDEFGVVLDACDREHAMAVAKQIKDTVSGHRFVWYDNVYTVGVSIGLAMVSRHDLDTGEILKRADSACYIAKDEGRNRIHAYEVDDELAQRHEGEMRWVNRIRIAMENDLMRLYQHEIRPVDPAAGKRHFEVLLRIVGPEGQLHSPAEFVPAAERYGLMPKIDRWVLAESMAFYAERILTSRGPFRPIMFVNVSGQSLADDEFARRVADLLDRYRIPEGHICLEITETAAISNLRKALRLMSELKKKGCLFALDDFGSGLSSFGYFKSLPIDYLKIDGEFVRDIEKDRISRAMVRSIHEVGHTMGLKTIGEFVEDDLILNRLAEIGIDYAQGYAISIPKPLRYRDIPEGGPVPLVAPGKVPAPAV